jgi:hypothetical protein
MTIPVHSGGDTRQQFFEGKTERERGYLSRFGEVA